MSTIVTRAGKGSPLTHTEVDDNFTNLNTDKVEKTAAAITGGTINGTTIGATTPSTGNFTTLTAQTEVLRGTGNNLLAYSQAQTNAYWTTLTNTTVAASATIDPLGGNNTYAITCTSTSGSFGKAQTLSSGINYTMSVWIRRVSGSGAVKLTVGDNVSGSALSVTSSWQRFSQTATPTTTTIRAYIELSALNDVVEVFGFQLELGSTANTYIPTTTTAVYGTPTLSFSGVSTIGLEQTGALYLQPAGTGAIQAQATTSTSAGGNARGANAVDLQKERASASQVVSGSNGFIGGGYANTVSNYCGAISGGYANSAAYLNNVGGGQSNNASATWASISGGGNNIGSGYASFIGSGASNTSGGFFNVIGGGFTNSGTANAAVTTQATSTITSGSTAVTLSGSNASIKVGQYITGTPIATDTYVAAISGTSLTLSKNATSSTNATLFFFTPHGVVVGGGNNQATGSYSVICGGGDAGSSANRNVASGDWSFVGGGRGNTASGMGAVIAGGGYYNGLGASAAGNTASGDGAFVGAGFSNSASSFGSSILGGNNNTANATYSVVLGSQNGIVRGIQGNTVSPASATPIGTPQGSAQSALLILGRQTTDATATVLCSNSSAAGTTNQVILPNNSAYLFKATVISGVTGGGNTSGWKLEGVIKRGANAASTAIVGSVTTTLLAQDAGASTWAVTATADTTNGGLKITFTGQAGTTIRTVCKVETTEMTY